MNAVDSCETKGIGKGIVDVTLLFLFSRYLGC